MFRAVCTLNIFVHVTVVLTQNIKIFSGRPAQHIVKPSFSSFLSPSLDKGHGPGNRCRRTLPWTGHTITATLLTVVQHMLWNVVSGFMERCSVVLGHAVVVF